MQIYYNLKQSFSDGQTGLVHLPILTAGNFAQPFLKPAQTVLLKKFLANVNLLIEKELRF